MKILQIVPADGWFAIYSNPDYSEPLACWALVEGHQNREGEEVVGMVVELDSAELHLVSEAANFINYSKTTEE